MRIRPSPFFSRRFISLVNFRCRKQRISKTEIGIDAILGHRNYRFVLWYCKHAKMSLSFNEIATIEIHFSCLHNGKLILNLYSIEYLFSKKCLADTMRVYKKFALSHAKIRFVFDEMQSSRFLENIVGRAKWLVLGLPSTVIANIVPAFPRSPFLIPLPLANNKSCIFRNLIFKRRLVVGDS